jgi:hypothetical protein
MKAFVILYLVLLCGCAHRPAAPGAPSAIEQGCDASAVPRCAQIALRYDKGCEKLQAKR